MARERETRHLAALVLATLAVAGGGAIARAASDRMASEAIASGAELPGDITNRGLTIQRAALEQPDAVLLFGSSEIARSSPFRAMEFFSGAPTSFQVVGVAARGTPLAVTAFDLAALDGALRGRPVVVSVSHPFFHSESSDDDLGAYLGTFSRLHATRLAFGLPLPDSLARRVAARVLSRDTAIAGDPLVRAGLRGIENGGLAGRVWHGLLFPMGRVQLAVRELQDHARTLLALRHARRSSRRGPSAPIDWDVLRDSAERLSREAASGNPYGFEDTYWRTYRDALLAQVGTRHDAEWSRGVTGSPAWADLDLILDILTTRGARPLLLSLPYKGPYADAQGTTPDGRRVYYDSLRARARRAGVPVRDFAEFESDTFFTRDQAGHPSPAAWILYDRTIDDFVRGATP